MFEQPNLNARKARWLDFISEYDLELRHIKGMENKVPYALSRRVHFLHEIYLSKIEENLKA